MHIFHLTAVFRSCGNNINSCSAYAAVTKHIRQLCTILFCFIKLSCKPMPQIMRKHLLRIYARFFAKRLHLPPDICAVNRFSCSCYKNHTAFYSLLRRIAEQFLFKLSYINTDLVFDLQLTIASPQVAASTVIYCSSLIRIPVPQMVCKIRFSRSLCLLFASQQSLMYSALLSSLASGMDKTLKVFLNDEISEQFF